VDLKIGMRLDFAVNAERNFLGFALNASQKILLITLFVINAAMI
jgi:hypothetical protein